MTEGKEEGRKDTRKDGWTNKEGTFIRKGLFCFLHNKHNT